MTPWDDYLEHCIRTPIKVPAEPAPPLTYEHLIDLEKVYDDADARQANPVVLHCSPEDVDRVQAAVDREHRYGVDLHLRFGANMPRPVTVKASLFVPPGKVIKIDPLAPTPQEATL